MYLTRIELVITLHKGGVIPFHYRYICVNYFFMTKLQLRTYLTELLDRETY